MKEVPLTTMNGERISITPLDVKSVREIDGGMEADLHNGKTYRFPISRRVWNHLMVIDLSGSSNRVSVIDPIDPNW